MGPYMHSCKGVGIQHSIFCRSSNFSQQKDFRFKGDFSRIYFPKIPQEIFLGIASFFHIFPWIFFRFFLYTLLSALTERGKLDVFNISSTRKRSQKVDIVLYNT